MAICRLVEANAQPQTGPKQVFRFHVNMTNRDFAVSVTDLASILALLSEFRMYPRQVCRPKRNPPVAAALRPPAILRSKKASTPTLIEKISHSPL